MSLSLPTPIAVREPGLSIALPGEERYTISARGLTALPIWQGDILTISDPEGCQRAHLAAYDHQGNPVTQRIGLQPAQSGAEIAACLRSGGDSALRLNNRLRAFNIDLADAEVCELLAGDSAAGNQHEFVSHADALLLIAAPGEAMAIEGGLPASGLVVTIKRAHPEVAEAAMRLPDALADSKLDFQVDRRSAKAYEVKAGDYIQIIDVAGRQCSDFQCFSVADLDKGKENCLDATTTRALMGSAYPGPGLFAKFYDVDFNPLLEVVQDTCGRHDSFGLACTDKYYDEMGYPGHVNCSDNFNYALDPYSVKPRRGWMAMNLFFNTFFDDAYQFMFDDPWSRPGDYVLMRALTDMVCVSSACPCDIDPANGWQPTDIHVRTYDQKNLFKRAIAFRKTTDSAPVMTQETGFHSRTSALTRNFIDYNGYWLANNFNNLGSTAEYWACREGVVVTDLSPLRKYEVVGPDAETLLHTCVTRDVRRLSPGQVVYTAMCYEGGGMIDDGTVFRIAKDNFRWVGGCDSSGLWLRQQAQERGLRAWVKDSTNELHNLQVQGPKSLAVLRDIIWTRPDQTSIDELAWFRFSIARVGGEMGIPIVISRTGYTGELGYEIFCHPKHAAEIWDAVWQAGEPHKIAPLGLEALDLLRVEAGLIFAGYEFCDQTDPFEAGIGFTVPLKSKTDDFIGREALLKRRDNPQRKLVGLELMGGEIAGNGDGVFIGRNQVGEVTSGIMSPILKKNIALCRVNVQHCEIGTELEVGKLDGHQKRIACKIVSFPHFDPKKERVRGNYDA